MKNILTILLLICLTSCDSLWKNTMQDKGVSRELAAYRAETLKNIYYTLSFSIPSERHVPIQGKMRLKFELGSVEEPLILDFNAPTTNIRSVSSPMTGHLNYEHINEHIIIEPIGLREGFNDIEIEFTATELGLNRQNDFIYTLLVPDRASSLFPCFDQPDLKGTFALTLEVPEDWVALTTGTPESENILHQRKTIGFDRTLPISTYLFSFAAGKFDQVSEEKEGRTMTFYHRESDSLKVERNISEIMALHWKSLEWLEEYTGMRYPFKKFDFVALPSFQYGGMEHPGSIHYRARSLFLDETATTSQYLGRASLIAHETAHMWFGNLVTMKWFDDVWLKEVFANFMADKIVNPSFPNIDHDLKFLLRHHPAAYAIDRSTGANAIKQPLENLKQAGTLYGGIIYNKAPIMMKKLEALIGEDAFQAGIRQYLKDFSYGNADWSDLVEIMGTQSGQDLNQWSTTWISSPGMPRITVERKETTVELQSADPLDDDRIWPQSLTIATPEGSMEMKINEDHQALGISSDAAFIIPNAGRFEYGSFVLDPQSGSYLLDNVRQIEEPYQRGVVWLDLYETLLQGQIGYATYLSSLIESLKVEEDRLLIDLLVRQVNTLYWRLMNDEGRQQIGNQVEDTLWDLALQTADREAQAVFFKNYIEMVNTDAGLERLYQLWDQSLAIPGLSLAEDDFSNLALNLALRDHPESATILNLQLENIDNEDRKKRFRFIMPSTISNPKTRDQFFLSLSLKANRDVEPWVLDGLRYLHHPLRTDHSIQHLRAGLGMLEEIQLTGDIFFPTRWLDATLWGHNTPEALGIVDGFIAENPALNERLLQKLLQSSDLLRRAVSYQPATPQ